MRSGGATGRGALPCGWSTAGAADDTGGVGSRPLTVVSVISAPSAEADRPGPRSLRRICRELIMGLSRWQRDRHSRVTSTSPAGSTPLRAADVEGGSDQYPVAGASSGAPSPHGSSGQVRWYGWSPASWSHSARVRLRVTSPQPASAKSAGGRSHQLRSHTCTVPSLLALASRPPLGLNATAVTGPVWPVSGSPRG